MANLLDRATWARLVMVCDPVSAPVRMRKSAHLAGSYW